MNRFQLGYKRVYVTEVDWGEYPTCVLTGSLYRTHIPTMGLE